MIFLPIVERELRVAARRSVTYWSRLSTAAVALTVTMIVLRWLGNLVATPLLSQALFQGLIWLVFLYCLLVGARITADCISVEKRDGTLGLLFLTDLSGLDVALGKLAATSLPAVYGLLASVPILAIPLLLGGVSAAELGRATLVLLNTLFFSLSAGLFVSAISRDERKAAGAAVLLILFIAAGLPVFGFVHLIYLDTHGVPIQTAGTVPQVLLPYVFSSPAFACFLGFDRYYLGAARMFWGSVGMTHALGWGFLGAAAAIVPRIWQDRPSTGGVLGWGRGLGRGLLGDPARRTRTRRRRLERNPVYWLATRSWIRTADIWLILLALGGVWIWVWRKLGNRWLDLGVASVTAITFQLILKFWTAGAASSPLVEELRTGTLELLLSTRLSVDEILRGRLLALRRQVLGPALVILVVGGLLWWAAPDWRNQGGSERADTIAMIVGDVLMFGADLFAIAWVGLWMGICSTNARKAAGGTALRVLILPWLMIGAICSAWSFLSWKLHWTYQPGFRVGLGLWFGVGMLVDGLLWQWSQNRLRAEFRVRAMLRYAPESTNSPWYQLGRRYARWRLKAARTRPAAA